MADYAELATRLFAFWFFAFAIVVLYRLMIDGYLRIEMLSGSRGGGPEANRVAAFGAPLFVLALYLLQVIDGWDAAVAAKTLPELSEGYLAVLGLGNGVYLSEKFRRRTGRE